MSSRNDMRELARTLEGERAGLDAVLPPDRCRHGVTFGEHCADCEAEPEFSEPDDETVAELRKLSGAGRDEIARLELPPLELDGTPPPSPPAPAPAPSPLELEAREWWDAITAAERSFWLAIASADARSSAGELEGGGELGAWRAFCEQRYQRACRAWLALTAAERAGDVASVANLMVARFPELSLSSARFLAARFRATTDAVQAFAGSLELELGDVAAGDWEGFGDDG